MNALAPLKRPGVVGAGIGAAMGATTRYFAPQQPDTGDAWARIPNALLGATIGGVLGLGGAKGPEYANALLNYARASARPPPEVPQF